MTTKYLSNKWAIHSSIVVSHSFFVPKEARWRVIANTFENIGETVDKVCGTIERANTRALTGVLTNIIYNDKKRFPDDVLLQLVSHFNQKHLRNFDLENEDIEYLLEQFAD